MQFANAELQFKIVIDIKNFFTRHNKLQHQNKYKSHLDFGIGRIDLDHQNRHHCKKALFLAETFLDFYAFEEIQTQTNAQTFKKL